MLEEVLRCLGRRGKGKGMSHTVGKGMSHIVGNSKGMSHIVGISHTVGKRSGQCKSKGNSKEDSRIGLANSYRIDRHGQGKASKGSCSCSSSRYKPPLPLNTEMSAP
jgi:hypothetical protein